MYLQPTEILIWKTIENTPPVTVHLFCCGWLYDNFCSNYFQNPACPTAADPLRPATNQSSGPATAGPMTIHPDGPMAAQLVAPIGTEPAAPMVTSFDNGTMRDGQSPCDVRHLLTVQTEHEISRSADRVTFTEKMAATIFGAPDVGLVSRAPDVGADSRAPDVEVVPPAPDVEADSRAPFVGADFPAPDVRADSRAPDMGAVCRKNYEETSEFCSAVRDGKVWKHISSYFKSFFVTIDVHF